MLNQNRGHNNASELTTIAGASTYVGHDAAGKMTKVPKPTSWSSAYDLEFDAWNRLVGVKDGGKAVGLLFLSWAASADFEDGGCYHRSASLQ